MIPSTFSITFGTNSSVVHAECSFYMAKADELIESLKGVCLIFSKKTLTLLESYSTNYTEKDQFLFYLSFFAIDSLKYFAENSLLSSFSKIAVHKPAHRDLQYTFRSEKILFFSSFFNTDPLKKKIRKSSPLLFFFKTTVHKPD